MRNSRFDCLTQEKILEIDMGVLDCIMRVGDSFKLPLERA